MFKALSLLDDEDNFVPNSSGENVADTLQQENTNSIAYGSSINEQKKKNLKKYTNVIEDKELDILNQNNESSQEKQINNLENSGFSQVNSKNNSYFNKNRYSDNKFKNYRNNNDSKFFNKSRNNNNFNLNQGLNFRENFKQDIQNDNKEEIKGKIVEEIQEKVFEEETKQELNKSKPIDLDNGKDYVFTSKWNIWVHESNSADWSFDSYKIIYSIYDIETFWKFFSNIRKLDIVKYQYFIIREGSGPYWEHETNRNGGTCSIRVTIDKCIEVIEQIAILVINESFTSNYKDINGITISTKLNWGLIKIWNKDSEDDTSLLIPKYIIDTYNATPRFNKNKDNKDFNNFSKN